MTVNQSRFKSINMDEENFSLHRFFRRNKWKLIVTLLFVGLCYEMPLLGYAWRVGLTVYSKGFGQESLVEIKYHTDWFKRYFDGPMRDEEMIRFYFSHRDDLNRLAHILEADGSCNNSDDDDVRRTCRDIEKRLRLSGSPTGGSFYLNAAMRNPNDKICGLSCSAREFRFTDTELQYWYGTSHPDIFAWEKRFLRLPQLVSAERFGLNSGEYPEDPVRAISSYGYIKVSLDTIPSELDADPEGYKGAAVRHIENEWFLTLVPMVKGR
jgi:hypothetical protein